MQAPVKIENVPVIPTPIWSHPPDGPEPPPPPPVPTPTPTPTPPPSALG